MRGLLLKDLYVIRDGLLMMVVTLVIVGAGMAFLISPWVLTVIAATTLSIQGATTIQNDRTSRWHDAAALLPLPRSTVITSKYLLYLALCMAGIALGFAVSAGMTALGRAFDAKEAYLYTCTAVTVSLLPGSIGLPCAFKLEGEKILVGMMLAYAGVSVLFVGAVLAVRYLLDLKAVMPQFMGCAALFSAACYGISWWVGARRLPLRQP